MSDLSDLLTVAHLSWVTWAIHSQSLICLERCERISHSSSFDLSEMSNERMSKFPALAGRHLIHEWRYILAKMLSKFNFKSRDTVPLSMYSNVLRFFAIQRYTSKIEIIWLIKKFFPARISYLGFKSPVHVNKKYTIDFSSLESATVSWYCSTNGSPPEMSMLHSA